MLIVKQAGTDFQHCITIRNAVTQIQHHAVILIAEHRTGVSLDVPSLSDGTLDPLYLALRLAVVQEHNATREPLPFIADDLLLNLDNTRAQAAFRTLAKIAASSQVLFFTHHAHMVDPC